MSLQRLFFDIETVPNVGVFWKASSKIWMPYENIVKEKRICCIAYKWEGNKTIHSVDWGTGTVAGYRKMLKEFWAVAEAADELVGHNIDRFDLKWVNAEFLHHDIPSLTAPKTYDTLVVARKNFYLNSNRLDYLHRFLFGSQGKYNKPDFEVWKQLAIQHNDGLLKEMVSYCRNDITMLEEVFQELSRFHGVKTHAGVLDGGPKWSCAHCGSESVRRKKRRVTAKGTVQHSMVCQECGKHWTISNTAYQDWMEVKNVDK